MSSATSAPPSQNYRLSGFSDKSGRNIPYVPFPNARKPKRMSVSKVRRLNPYSLNVPHHSNY